MMDSEEWQQRAKELQARLALANGPATEPMYDGSKMKMPASFPKFIREIERQGDRVKVEVAGKLYWIIYDEDPWWEEIAA